MTEITPQEAKAIRALKQVAKTWPESLWLFSASGTLCVMMKDENGQSVYTDSGGIDPSYEVDTIRGIDNDGGDW